MLETPGSLRLHIGIFGRRNTGKSTLMNRLAGRNTSITSSQAGTTADPVRRSMEMPPLGSVQLIDTAGIDDVGTLGEKRSRASDKIIGETDLAILLIESGSWNDYEERLLKILNEKHISIVVAVNKTDIAIPDRIWLNGIKEKAKTVVLINAEKGEGIEELKWALIENAPEEWINAPPVLRDLVKPDEVVVQVMPIDIEAPMGRILLPQVQAVRDVMDAGGISVIVKDTELKEAMDTLEMPPGLVVTDSQAFKPVSLLTPPQSRLTSYSTLFARSRGDLSTFIRGVRVVDELEDGDRVLIAEACVHHPIGNDIGRVQIPEKIQNHTGKKIQFDFVQGRDYPDDLTPYRMVIHCGACVFNRRNVLHRIREADCQGVAIVNYGIMLAYLAGVLERAVKPFAEICPEIDDIQKN